MYPAKKYYDRVLSMGLSKNQNEYYSYLSDNLKEAVRVHSCSIRELNAILHAFMSDNPIKEKACFENAYKVCQFHPDIRYVEGVAFIYGAMIDHAWNSFRGVHFDLTEEHIHAGKDVHLENYAYYASFSLEQLCEFSEKTQTYGPYVPFLYRSNYFVNSINS